jgi:glycine/D-amino acid oxidase-like deaminating enzyme
MIHLPANPGISGWKAILPSRQAHKQLEKDISADYLVIGAGFAGLSAARRLNQLRPDAKIVVLEACEVSEGPAGRNSGFMIDLPHDLSSEDYLGSANKDIEQTRINRSAIEFAKNAAEEYQMPSEALQQVGKINAAATHKGMTANTDYAKHLTKTGEYYRLLDAAEMQELTGINYYQGGLWTPGTVLLQPALYIRSLADGVAMYSNLYLYENSAVIELTDEGRYEDRTLWKAKTMSGSVISPKVILAVNGLIEKFGYFQKRLMHVFTYASMTRQLSTDEVKNLGGQSAWSFTTADPMGSSVRRLSGTGGDRIMVRNRFTYEPSMEVSGSRIMSVSNSHISAFSARFPMLDKVSMEYCWGGRLCLSLNNVFAQGEVAEGLYSACCQNGLGTAKGTAIGVIAAEKAAQATDSAIDNFIDEEPPKKLPPKSLMYLGANGYLRWKEWRAGKEK